MDGFVGRGEGEDGVSGAKIPVRRRGRGFRSVRSIRSHDLKN